MASDWKCFMNKFIRLSVFSWIIMLSRIQLEAEAVNQRYVERRSRDVGDELVKGRQTYEIIVPQVKRYNRQTLDYKPLQSTFIKGGHLTDDVIVVLSAFNVTLTLDLHINKHLFGAAYVEKTAGQDGIETFHSVKHGEHHCFYKGTVRGHSRSSVAVSTCSGISGSVTVDDVVYYIEPVDRREGKATLSSKHYLIKDPVTAGQLKTNASCGQNSTSLHHSTRSRRSLSWQDDVLLSTSRFLELYVVNDFSQYLSYGQNVNTVVHRTKDIINIVSSMYRQLNIYIVLVGIEVWTDGNRINISGNADETMNGFLEYRRNYINRQHRNDNAQLIIGDALGDGVVGKAPIMSICTYRNSGGVSADRASFAGGVAATVAHELGHNFGFLHDDDTCNCPENRCIMSASGSGWFSPTKWSQCSRQQLADAFHQGMDYCLRDLPPGGLYGTESTCGNGLTEEGEDCDCGLEKDCNNPCCNATTCRLAVNATCGAGLCCDLTVCKVKPAATECRPASGDCDLGEYCDGVREHCPSDAFMQNGVDCQVDEVSSYCYKGRCQTSEAQCRMLWGPSGRVSHPLCYEHFNIMGTANGHCGFNWVTERFQRCPARDVKCGMMHCEHTSEKLMFWKEALAYTLPDTWVHTRDNIRHDCKSVILDVGLDSPDPGMAFDGTKCGDQQMCVSHQCVNITTLNISTCPDCHSHGVCNNLGQCHCDSGFAPPHCDRAGYGGSLHSGPASTTFGRVHVGLAVGLTFLVLSVLSIIIICLYRRHNPNCQFKQLLTRRCRLRLGRYLSVHRSSNQRQTTIVKKSNSSVASISRTASLDRSSSCGVRRTASFRPEDISTPRLESSTNSAISPILNRSKLLQPVDSDSRTARSPPDSIPLNVFASQSSPRHVAAAQCSPNESGRIHVPTRVAPPPPAVGPKLPCRSFSTTAADVKTRPLLPPCRPEYSNSVGKTNLPPSVPHNAPKSSVGPRQSSFSYGLPSEKRRAPERPPPPKISRAPDLSPIGAAPSGNYGQTDSGDSANSVSQLKNKFENSSPATTHKPSPNVPANGPGNDPALRNPGASFREYANSPSRPGATQKQWR